MNLYTKFNSFIKELKYTKHTFYIIIIDVNGHV